MSMYYASKTIEAFTDTATDINVSSSMIETAIRNAVVIPFSDWMLKTWGRLLVSSHYVLLGIAIIGGITYIVGIDKGKKIALVATLTYLGMQFFNYIVVGG